MNQIVSEKYETFSVTFLHWKPSPPPYKIIYIPNYLFLIWRKFSCYKCYKWSCDGDGLFEFVEQRQTASDAKNMQAKMTHWKLVFIRNLSVRTLSESKLNIICYFKEFQIGPSL